MLGSDTTLWGGLADLKLETADDVQQWAQALIARWEYRKSRLASTRRWMKSVQESIDRWTELQAGAEYALASLVAERGPIVVDGVTYAAEIVTEFGETYPKLVVRPNGTWEAMES